MQDDVMGLYEQALASVEVNVAHLQAEQRAHLQCRKGCDSCCMDTFRVRYVELLYLITGFFQAKAETRERILANLVDPAYRTQKRCPVLIDGACGLYLNRPALCRAYGLMIKLDADISTCHLNYNDKPTEAKLNVLDMVPIYDLMDHLSDAAWQQMNPGQDVAPLMTIRQFFETILQEELATLSPPVLVPEA